MNMEEFRVMLRRICKTALFLAMVLVVSVVAASAQSRGRGINAREHRQQQRIAQGVRSGELTSRETYRLERQEQRIDRQEDRFRESGDGLSPRERAKLEHELNRESRNIYHQKHDRQDSPRP